MTTGNAVAPAQILGGTILWMTGLSGAGKSTIAEQVHIALTHAGRASYVLDGDVLRTGLCRDLGFSAEDRLENVRRVAEVARLIADAGLVAIVGVISPSAEGRALARTIAGMQRFVEVHVHAPLSVVEARDPKGLYKKARAGLIKNFTGIDAPYEAPEHPDVFLDTEMLSIEETTAKVLAVFG